jgi:hypothetical protein
MIVLAVILAGLQAGTPVCSGNVDERNCRLEDGSTYVERRLVDQVVRQGTTPTGEIWTLAEDVGIGCQREDRGFRPGSRVPRISVA